MDHSKFVQWSTCPKGEKEDEPTTSLKTTSLPPLWFGQDLGVVGWVLIVEEIRNLTIKKKNQEPMGYGNGKFFTIEQKIEND